MNELRTPYTQGHYAYYDNIPITSNPLPEGEDANNWEAGWLGAFKYDTTYKSDLEYLDDTPSSKGFYNGYNDLKTPNPYDSAEDAYNEWIEGREQGLMCRSKIKEGAA